MARQGKDPAESIHLGAGPRGGNDVVRPGEAGRGEAGQGMARDHKLNLSRPGAQKRAQPVRVDNLACARRENSRPRLG